jgi:Baseplate J-like protein
MFLSLLHCCGWTNAHSNGINTRLPQGEMRDMNRYRYILLLVKPFQDAVVAVIAVVIEESIHFIPADTEEYISALPSPHTRKKGLKVHSPWLLAVSGVIILLALVACYLLAMLTTTVRVSTTTVVREEHITLTLKPSVQGQPQSGVRLLTVTATTTRSPVQATGILYRPGTQARGTLTWYNQMRQTQTIPSGTILSIAHNMQIVTDAEVTVPASSPPTISQASGPAHIGQAGQQGNIPAGAVNALCSCSSGVSATNLTAFSGGINEQTSSILLQTDVDQAVASQKEPLTQQASDTLKHQMQASEQTVALPSCSFHTSADHTIGGVVEPGTQIKVSLTISCTSEVFDQHEVSNEAKQHFIHQGTHDLGKQFLPNDITEKIEQSMLLDQQEGTLQITLHVQGTWIYQLSNEQIHTLQSQLAGMTPNQARQFATHIKGIHHVTITPACLWICTWFPLSNNPEKIQIVQVPSPSQYTISTQA